MFRNHLGHRHRIAAVVCAGLLAPVAIASAPAGAIDQDLVVSAASGAPGDVIEVSSASCGPVGDPSVDEERFLRVQLITGTAPDEILTGIGWGYGSASIVLPDWADPDAPAVIEASCVTFTFDPSTGPGEVTEAYDPVAFDLLPAAGAPTQSVSYSRTSLLAGQAYVASGSGCTSGDEEGGVELWAGGDLSGRTFEDLASYGFAQVEGGGFDARVDLVEWSWGVSWSTIDGGRPTDIEVRTRPTDIPAGTYTSISYCSSYDEATDTSTFLLLPPQAVEVTGRAPMDAMALDVSTGAPDAALSGAECTVGDVEGALEGLDLEAEDDFDGLIRGGPEQGPSPFGPTRTAGSPATRSVGHNAYVPFTTAPDATGVWTHPEVADFEIGVLVGSATCGDPTADGFHYDLAAAIVEVPEPVDTTTTVPTTVVTPAPQGAVPITGSPAYAG